VKTIDFLIVYYFLTLLIKLTTNSRTTALKQRGNYTCYTKTSTTAPEIPSFAASP
jgi:hypothetical protein